MRSSNLTSRCLPLSIPSSAFSLKFGAYKIPQFAYIIVVINILVPLPAVYTQITSPREKELVMLSGAFVLEIFTVVAAGCDLTFLYLTRRNDPFN